MKFRKLISALTAGCLMCSGAAGISASATGFSRASVHDPSIVKLEDGSYYIIGSHIRRSDLQGQLSGTGR